MRKAIPYNYKNLIKERVNNMPIVHIELFEGRTYEQKKRMVEMVTQAIVESAGAKPENVTIVIRDMAKENHAKAGVLSSER